MGFRQRHRIALTELVIMFALGLTRLIISRPWFVSYQRMNSLACDGGINAKVD